MGFRRSGQAEGTARAPRRPQDRRDGRGRVRRGLRREAVDPPVPRLDGQADPPGLHGARRTSTAARRRTSGRVSTPAPSCTAGCTRCPGTARRSRGSSSPSWPRPRGSGPEGWQEAAGKFGDDIPRSVADIDGPESLAKVREWKKAQKAAKRDKQDNPTARSNQACGGRPSAPEQVDEVRGADQRGEQPGGDLGRSQHGAADAVRDAAPVPRRAARRPAAGVHAAHRPERGPRAVRPGRRSRPPRSRTQPRRSAGPRRAARAAGYAPAVLRESAARRRPGTAGPAPAGPARSPGSGRAAPLPPESPAAGSVRTCCRTARSSPC